MAEAAKKKSGFSSALIIDDHPLFCDALAMMLKFIEDVEDVVISNLLSDALDRLASGYTPDIIILDLNLPDVNGLDGLIRLSTITGGCPIIVVSSITDNRIISSVIRAGARGYVPKHGQSLVFRAAFEALARGETYLPEGFVDVDDTDGANTARDLALSRLSTLTKQQIRILQLICEGKLNKQIAYDLSIAETTVKAHVSAIMRKLGVQSRTQAVLLAGRASFVNLLPNESEPF